MCIVYYMAYWKIDNLYLFVSSLKEAIIKYSSRNHYDITRWSQEARSSGWWSSWPPWPWPQSSCTPPSRTSPAAPLSPPSLPPPPPSPRSTSPPSSSAASTRLENHYSPSVSTLDWNWVGCQHFHLQSLEVNRTEDIQLLLQTFYSGRSENLTAAERRVITQYASKWGDRSRPAGNSNTVISERKLSRNSCCTGTSSQTQTPQTGKLFLVSLQTGKLLWNAKRLCGFR